MARTAPIALVSALLISLFFAGCYNWRQGVSETASLQHDCPVSNIVVVADNGDGYARVVQLDVCGQRRVYQDLGGRSGYAWVDMTPEPTSGAEAPPQQQSPQQIGGTSPAATAVTRDDDPFIASIRARIDERRSGILACSGGSIALEATWGESGEVQMGARGVTDPAIAQCIGAALGAIQVPAGVAPGRIIHPVAP